MKLYISTLLILTTLAANSQDKYTDSIYQYQLKYKTDLFEIIKSDTGFVRFYNPDANYRVVADVKFLKDQKFFDMRTSDGKSHKAKKYARVSFTLNGKTHNLFAYQLGFLMAMPDHKNAIFVPFLDEGSGELTYGGGRYIDCETTDIVDDKLVLDFNKAYNPYCAFSTGYSCPIPPRENTLQTTVAAGEKQFAKPAKSK